MGKPMVIWGAPMGCQHGTSDLQLSHWDQQLEVKALQSTVNYQQAVRR